MDHENGAQKTAIFRNHRAVFAIFDYNNDGWMDILLVNSGTASFTPRYSTSLGTLPEQPRRHIH